MQAVAYALDDQSQDWTALMAGPSHFSPELIGEQFVEGDIVWARPLRACDERLQNTENLKGKIVVAERGDCTFVSKARLAQKAGAAALIVCDNVAGSSGETQPMFAMSGDGTDDVVIPVVFMYTVEFAKLSQAKLRRPELRVRIMQMVEFKRWQIAKEAHQNKTAAAAATTTAMSKKNQTRSCSDCSMNLWSLRYNATMPRSKVLFDKHFTNYTIYIYT